MEKGQDLKIEEIDNSKKINLILYVIETILYFVTIPLQIIKIVHDVAEYPDGHGGILYRNYYYNLWDNIDHPYMILFNILLGVSIIFNIVCIIRIKNINKKILLISHILFISIAILFLIILFYGTMNSRKY